MAVPSCLADVEAMVRDQVQENIHLDYKDSRAMTLAARDEIAKDVSAFANSDGGVLIYGVEENNNFPLRIDAGVEDKRCSREWIENTITSRITPKVDDVRIVPIPVAPGRSLYVISIAKSFRGPHQSADKKYYKRHNFKSEPMEDYEISDVRSRRKRLSPLISFEIGEWRRFVAAFDVGNVSDLVAEDVQFEFTATLPWPNNREEPSLFAKGMSKFPPKQRFRFLYFPFHEILSQKSGVPLEFSVRISYYHPDSASRVTDVWPVNFAAYEHSMAIRPEIEEQAKDVVEGLGKLNDHLASLNKILEKLLPISGSTGLDLSVPTLRNLKRVLVQNEEPEPISPEGCDWAVIKELLGVDIQMAYQISRVFATQISQANLKRIAGMTDEIMSRIRVAFILPSELPEESENATPHE
jgi:hypothetical protein